VKAYYYVYRVGHGKPTVQHPTLEEATREALRLSGQHPGETFEILKCLARARTVTPSLTWAEGNEPGEDGWIAHTPGEPKPCIHDDVVTVKLRNGAVFHSPSLAGYFYWGKHTNPQMEIVAWKPWPTSTPSADR
jgi:hypothetical protein